MRNQLVTLSTLLCLATLACGDSDATGGAGGSGGNSSTGGAGAGGNSGTGGTGATGGGGAAPTGSVEDDYCAPLAALLCGQAAACSCEEVSPSGQFDTAACTAGYTAQCLEAYSFLVDAVASGAARVDAAKAATCIAELANATPPCEAPRGTIPLGLCPAWYASDEALGATCNFPICAGGEGFCTMAGGTCTPRPVSGEACSGLECAAGLLCLDGMCGSPGGPDDPCISDDGCVPPLRCLGGQCRALGSSGDACSDATECALGQACLNDQCTVVDPTPCTDDASCGNQATCVTLPRCSPQGAVGTTCDQDAACQAGLYCDSATSQCAALPVGGEACVNGTFCAPSLGCTTDFGNCAPLPGNGMPCAFGPMGPTLCSDGLGCLQGTCGALPGDGEACTIDNRCAPPLGCDFTPNGSVCVTKKAAGGACQNDQVCADGLHCDFNAGACAANFAIGVGCSQGNECGPQATCMPGAGGQFVCAPIPGATEVCLFDCTAGLYCAANPADAVCVAPICGQI